MDGRAWGTFKMKTTGVLEGQQGDITQLTFINIYSFKFIFNIVYLNNMNISRELEGNVQNKHENNEGVEHGKYDDNEDAEMDWSTVSMNITPELPSLPIFREISRFLIK